MIRTSRRTMLLAAAGLPMVGNANLADAADRTATASLLLFDPATEEGRRFADHARVLGMQPVAIQGDRVRFATPLVALRPRRIVAVTRHADRLFIGGIAAAEGYRERLAVRHVEGRCAMEACEKWAGAGAFLARADSAWPEALAALAAGRAAPASGLTTAPADAAGWILTRA
jgi:hypothetical protein